MKWLYPLLFLILTGCMSTEPVQEEREVPKNAVITTGQCEKPRLFKLPPVPQARILPGISEEESFIQYVRWLEKWKDTVVERYDNYLE